MLETVSDDEEGRSRSPGLQEVKVRLRPSPSPPPLPPNKIVSLPGASRHRRSNRRKTASQGDVVLIHYMSNLNRPDIAIEVGKNVLGVDSDSSGDSDEEMEDLDSKATAAQAQQSEAAQTQQSDAGQAQEEPNIRGRDATTIAQQALALHMLGTASNADSQRSPNYGLESEKSPESAKSPATDVSASEGLRGLALDGVPAPSSRHYYMESMKTPEEDRSQSRPYLPEDSLMNSPIGELLLKSVDSPAAEKLPALQSHSPPKGGPTSPQAPQLPSISNIIGDIDPQSSRRRQREHSFSSLPAQSPTFLSGPRSPPSVLPPLNHASPVLSQPAVSPISATGLPASFATFFSHGPLPRRTSQASETSPQGYPPPLHSASTTESYSQSSPDAYSPSNGSQPTPNDSVAGASNRMSIDGIIPTIVPPPPSSSSGLPISLVPPHGSGGFPCDFPGCTAAPFQTQYLLNSHANVHSHFRPHYCPVPNCPRAEGGKGFKRKNEMIRHGLVHDSPGYVCPFCPDREHKYPRPDNLQRHVRVHHPDKDRDDPKLKEVLAQRPDGGSRGRRRRMI